jgi:hypothetical protein
MSGRPGIPRGGGSKATAGEIGAKPTRHSRQVMPATASPRHRGLSCLVRYKRAGSEARRRSRGSTECKLQARELGGSTNSRDNKSTAEIGERHHSRGCKAGLLAPGARDSSQLRTIPLTRRCGAGCEAGARAVQRGTTRPTFAANLASRGVGSTQSKALWARERCVP